MSRIRSQLEAIRRNSAQSGSSAGSAGPVDEAYAEQPQYASPQPDQHSAPVREPQHTEYRQPQQAGGEIDRIRERLDQLTGVIGTLARSQPRAPEPNRSAPPQAPH
jgi:hypothetical protein